MKEQGTNSADLSRLYRQMEGKIEGLVERLLASRVGDKDNVLQIVQNSIERIFIASAMRITDNNVSQASKLLGINRNTLSKKLREMRRDA